MRLMTKLSVAASTLLWAIPSASALTWNCAAPEIDGPAGVSAVAILLSVGMMAYERIKR